MAKKRILADIDADLADRYKESLKDRDISVTSDLVEHINDVVNRHSDFIDNAKNHPTVFWCGQDRQDGERCCFNHWVGLPVRNYDGKRMPILSHELTIIEAMEKHRHVAINKPTGAGITELFMRYIPFLAITDTKMKDSTILLISGPNWDSSQELISRMSVILQNTGLVVKETDKEIKLIQNVTIISKPSNHVATWRGYPNISIIYGDESSYYNLKDDSEVKVLLERYVAKSNPLIVVTSTPGMARGWFFELFNSSPGDYKLIVFPYTDCIEMYEPAALERAKLDRSFPREYMNKFSIGMSNAYNYKDVDQEPYPFEAPYKKRFASLDPGYNRSGFCIAEEREDGKIYFIKAVALTKYTTPEIEAIVTSNMRNYDVKELIIDSSRPDIFDSLLKQGYHVTKFSFKDQALDATSYMAKELALGNIRIHPSLMEFKHEMYSVRLNDKGTTDKTTTSFDIHDAAIMAVWALKVYEGYSAISTPFEEYDAMRNLSQSSDHTDARTDVILANINRPKTAKTGSQEVLRQMILED